LEKVDVKSFATETEKADTIRMVNLYEFDGNGNQTMEVANPINDSTCLTDTAGSKVRQYLWDEDNRMLAANVNGFVSNYFYDAAGERTVKISAPDLAVFVNGAEALKNDSALVKFVGYVSPYLVVSNGGRYTKHIYAGTQRIASKVGDIEAFGADPRRVEYAGANLKEVDFGEIYDTQTKALLARYDSLGVMNKPRELNDYVGGQSFCCGEKEVASNNQTSDNTFETPDYEQLIFFYHPDHLGSTALVTDNDGNVVQSVAYIPYGEVFIEERNGTWNTPYLFNGKELDEETGLYYYGARYLNPTSGMWLSTDPLFEKYVGMSPYNYCADNPVKLVDPDGRFTIDAEVAKEHLTPQQFERFESIVKNIGNLFNEYKIEEVSKITGLSKEQIKNDLEYGKGPKIFINAYGNGDSQAANGIIELGLETLNGLKKDFEKITRYGFKEISKEVFGVAMLILHEYGHYGDQKTNGGYNSGQHINGTNYVDLNWGDSNQSKSIREGKQVYSMSRSGHRGDDMTVLFGLPELSFNSSRGALDIKVSNGSSYLKNNSILSILKVTR
jgi:RHS repeat-associated protein